MCVYISSDTPINKISMNLKEGILLHRVSRHDELGLSHERLEAGSGARKKNCVGVGSAPLAIVT
jgi:hypothetical protein